VLSHEASCYLGQLNRIAFISQFRVCNAQSLINPGLSNRDAVCTPLSLVAGLLEPLNNLVSQGIEANIEVCK